MRCMYCGSKNIALTTRNEGYSVAKGIAGQMLFGVGGAVMGVNGKKECIYHCSACGKDATILLNDVIDSNIDQALLKNDISELKRYKAQYYNIEWTPPVEVHVNCSIPTQTPVESPNAKKDDSELSLKQYLRERGYSHITINSDISRENLETVLLCMLELRGKISTSDLLNEQAFGKLRAQQVNATLFGLCKQGKVIKTVEDGKPYFQTSTEVSRPINKPLTENIVLEVLKRIGQSTVAELLEEEELSIYTNMNVSSVLRKLAENGRVKKTIGGNGKAFFEVR